jgi:EmrB/QacA subfamily drug resistance transporter
MMAVSLSVFMATLDVNIVSVSLPTLVRDLNTDFVTIQWVMLGYVLVVTSLTLSFARLGDMKGKRRLYAFGICLFTAGSLLCGLAPGVYWLILFRMVQGLGAAFTQALGAAIATEAFPSSERGKAMGVIGSTVSVGLAMGPAVGGMLIGAFGWRSVFLVNIPIGIFAVWATLKFVPETKSRESEATFDFAGAILMLFLMGTFALGMSYGQREGFSDPMALGLLSAAAMVLFIFIMVEKRVSAPMVDLSLFKNTLFSINLIMGWLVFLVIAAGFVLPFYLELVKGYTPTVVGLLMMVVPVSMGIFAPVAGRLADQFGARGISLIGLGLCVAGCLCIGSLNEKVSLLGTVLRLIPIGIGMGFFQSPNNSAIMGAVSINRLGIASGLMTLSRTLGHTTGIPLAGVAFTAWVLAEAKLPGLVDVAQAPPEALVAGLSGLYKTAALVAAVSSILAVIALYLGHRRKGGR